MCKPPDYEEVAHRVLRELALSPPTATQMADAVRALELSGGNVRAAVRRMKEAYAVVLR